MTWDEADKLTLEDALNMIEKAKIKKAKGEKLSICESCLLEEEYRANKEGKEISLNAIKTYLFWAD